MGHKEELERTRQAEAIDIVAGKVEKLHTNKSSLHSAFFEVEKAGARTMTEQKPADPQPERSAKVHDKQEAILKACEALAVSLAKQQEDINAIKHTHHISSPSYSSKAVNRPKPKNKKSNKKPAEANKKIKKPLPDSISVKPENGETSSAILKTIKEKLDISFIGSEVSSIKESRSGGILIRLRREDKNRDELIEALKTNLGSRAVIRDLVSLDDVDIQDLDKVTTATEVECSIRSTLGLAADDLTIKLKNIRPAYAGTQRATVRLRSADAITLAKKGRIRIGWINARLRLKETATRCFRCLGYGHTTHTCRGLDRAKACSLCTSESHRASSCNSPPKCAACLDMKEPTDHFPGSGKCIAYRLALSKTQTPNIEQREPDRVLDIPIHQQNAYVLTDKPEQETDRSRIR
ncbi:Uncharacterized protein FWK35_00018869 [Aphis craccivora]|uniref:CCHC-type domain-containing protein n=1 Tax=Aphis craccivora TaxID=307492 RepID=A0A6G0Y2Y8_APHCR|nr:Uncharacterized protein FWK35_00018869 [Aphis craccivora]